MERNAPPWRPTGSPRGLHRPFSDSLGRGLLRSSSSMRRHLGKPQGASGAPPSECKPSASASLGERTTAISEMPPHASQHIGTSKPPSGRSFSSPPCFGTGSEDPQSGQVRPFSRARRLSWRSCGSVSGAFLATPRVYPILVHRRFFLPLFTGVCRKGLLRCSFLRGSEKFAQGKATSGPATRLPEGVLSDPRGVEPLSTRHLLVQRSW
jgi:hypothetical protein